MLGQAVKDLVMPLFQVRARRFIEMMDKAEASGVSFDDSKKTVEYFLRSSELHIDEEVLNKIDKEDFVEIYDRFAVQIFRTYNIYNISSFDRETLRSKRMDQLFERPNLLDKICFQTAFKIFARKQKTIYNFCPDHVVVEKKDFPVTANIHFKFMTAVYDEFDSVAAVLVCEKLTPLQKTSSTHSQPTAEA